MFNLKAEVSENEFEAQIRFADIGTYSAKILFRTFDSNENEDFSDVIISNTLKNTLKIRAENIAPPIIKKEAKILEFEFETNLPTELTEIRLQKIGNIEDSNVQKISLLKDETEIASGILKGGKATLNLKTPLIV